MEQAHEREQKALVSLAWHINALERQKRLPSLESILRKLEPSAEAKKPIDERRRDFEELKKRSGYGGRNDPRRSPDSDPGDAR